MTSVSLNQAIDGKFLRSFQGLAQQNEGRRIGASSSVNIRDALRLGARTYANAVQALNATISFVQISRASLEKIEEITDKLITLADEASKSTTSSQQRREFDRRFKKLGAEFRDIIESGRVNNDNILTKEGIGEVLRNIGLDPEKSESIRAFYNALTTPPGDGALASEEIKGSRPARIPATAFAENQIRFTKEYDSIFASDRFITSRPDAFLMLEDLRALKTQVKKNINVLDEGLEAIGKNLQLVRATGLAFLEIEEQISGSEDAEEVARRVRDAIRRNAGAALLAQAENLEPITVATLALGQKRQR